MMRSFKPGGTAFATVLTCLTSIQSTLCAIPVDPGVVAPLRVAVGGLLVVLTTIESISHNAEDMMDLAGYLTETQQYLNSIKDPLSESLKRRITTLTSGIEQVVTDLEKLSKRSCFQRVIRAKGDVRTISGYTKRMDRLLHDFLLSGSIALEVNLIAARDDIHMLINDSRGAHDIFQSVHADTAAIKSFLRQDQTGLVHVARARFESSELPRCLKGTRVKLLEETCAWINNPRCERIFWLCGQAGTGKTTVALTVAEHCKKENRLGASFFFSRDHADRNDLRLVFPSIAHQLGIFHPPFKERVALVLKNNPDLCEAAAVYQFESLIVNPLQDEGLAIPSPVVVILDALDECTDDSPVSKILTILSGGIDRLPHVKFFLTSRPETNVTEGFRDPVLVPITQKCVLHDIESSVVDHDIETYLRTGFIHIMRRYSFPDSPSWPSDDIIGRLVQDSFRLFIFAATVLRFVGDGADDPVQQLKLLLNQSTQAESPAAPGPKRLFETLDNLYSQVLNNALPLTRDPDTFVLLKAIVGTIVLLCEPLPLQDLAKLLNVPTNVIRTSLRRLHSVLTVPKVDSSPINLCHPSFRDYITQRCPDKHYAIDAPFQHGQIAILCFEQMKSLRRDICMIGDPSMLSCEIDDLQKRLDEHVGPTLTYACMHWIVHFSKASPSLVLWNSLKEFFTKRFLYWLEVLSLLGSLQKVPGYLRSLIKTVERSSSKSAEVQELLRDCERFVVEFFEPIDASCLHIYYSALSFTPPKTQLYRTYEHELKLRGLGGIINPVCVTWGQHLQLMPTEGGACVAYSPDGSQLVSGSDDAAVRVWDVETGLTVRKMLGHSDWVTCVSFSRDGRYIASGSADLSVRIWSCETGLLVKELTGHAKRIWSISFSSKNQVVSGSDDCTIRIWSIANGSSTVLNGHDQTVRTVRFAPDDGLIASASDDGRVGIWDTRNENNRPSWLTGHTDAVYCVEFLDPGYKHKLASSSADMTVRIWDLENMSVIRVLKGHVDRVWTVTCSSNGRIASGSDDRTIRLWDLNADKKDTGKVLLGHTHWVNRLSYSPDGKRLASSSQDGTLRVWDGEGISTHQTTRSKSAPLTHYCSALSPTGTLVAAAYSDHKVHIRNLHNPDKAIRSFKLPASAFSLTFSHDEKHLLCVVGGQDLGIWEVSSGKNRWLHRTEDFFKWARYNDDGTAVIAEKWIAGRSTVSIPRSLHPLTLSLVVSNPGLKSHHYEFKDGWVFVVAGGQKKRILWIPAMYRHHDCRYSQGMTLWLGQDACSLNLTNWL